MARRSGHPASLGFATVAILVGATMVAYAASPYVALWRMSVALRSHDVASLRSEIDWSRVRDGLKQELTGALPDADQPTIEAVKPASVTTASDDELPEFGESFAKTAVGNVVDEDCDPEHVEAMFGSRPSQPAGIVAQARQMLAWAFFTGPKTFQALLRVSDDPHAASVRVSMIFTGRHGWRVTNVWLPQQMLSSSEANAT